MQQEHVPAVQINANASGEIDLLGLVGTLVDHKWLIAGITSVAMMVGVAYAVLATPVYRANALIQVEPKKNDLLGFSDVSSMLNQQSPSATEIELIRSRSVIGKAVDNLKLYIEITPNYFPVFGGFVFRHFNSDSSGSVANAWFGLNSFAWGGEELEVSQLEVPKALLGKDLILIAEGNEHFTLFDDDENILVEGEVGKSYNQNGIKVQVEVLRANPGVKFKVVRQPRLNSVIGYQEVLEVTERGKDSGIIALALESTEPDQAVNIIDKIANIYVRQNVERTSAEAAASLEFIRGQLPQVRKDLEIAENALNEYQTRSKSVDITLETKAILDQIVALDTSISELKLQQAEMDRKYTREHPAYKALISQIDELTAKQKRFTKKVESLPSTQQELLSLTRDVRVSTEIYTQLLNKSQELDVMRAGTIGNVRLIDNSDVNLKKPVKPQKPLVVLIATLFGAFIAIALVLIRKSLNRGLESPDAIEKLGLPVYASVPFSLLQRSKENKGVSGKRRECQTPYLLAVDHPTDLTVEALRSLRTSLHFAMLEATNNRLMISGPSPSVGKTFISSNLAVVIAQAGQRVLLVDVDMRKGYLHKMLGANAENGLSDLLAKRCDLTTAIHKTAIDNFDFISRGQIPPNPSELLMHANFSEFLDQVSEKYDLVILDTPPLLAVTDAAIVGRQSGTNMIVTRFAMNPAREIELTIRRFAQNGITLKGAIFNGVVKRASAYYGEKAYGYYHYEYKSD